MSLVGCEAMQLQYLWSSIMVGKQIRIDVHDDYAGAEQDEYDE